MSLINDLLKDLEKRENTHRDIPLITLAKAEKQNLAIYFDKKIIIASSMMFLIVTICLSVILLAKKHHPTLAPILQEKPVHQVINTHAKENQAWLDPVSINGITLQVKDNITELAFLLNHAALYRLTSLNMQNQISIVIDKSILQSELPPLNYLNTAIQKITTENSEGNTKFTLTLAPDAVVKFINLNGKEKNPELIIAIENNAIKPANSTMSSGTTVKTPVMRSLLIQQYQSALNAAENGNFDVALAQLDSLLKIDPAYKEARSSLVALLLDQNKQYKAQQLLDEGIKIDPNYLPFIELKARILTAQGNSQQALTLLQTYTPPIADNPDYHAFIAALYERNNKNLLAANIYRQLLTINPNNGNWWLGLGISLEKIGQGKEAILAYTKATTAGSLNAQSMAYLQTRLQKLQEAQHASE